MHTYWKVLLLVAVFAVAAAQGQQITYVFTSTASGTLNGSLFPFSNATLTIAVPGDIGNVANKAPGEYELDYPAGTATFTLSSLNGSAWGALSDAGEVIDVQTTNGGTLGLWDSNNSYIVSIMDSLIGVDVFANYNVATSIGPTPAQSYNPSLSSFVNLPTQDGLLSLTAQSNLTFQAFVGVPPPPAMFAPANGGREVTASTANLEWTGLDASSYDVYLGTSSSSMVKVTTTTATATSYAPPSLSLSTIYYWQVVANNADGSTPSAVWSFTTAGAVPATPILISPSNGATGASIAPSLTWSAASGATSYDVYFGTSPSPALVTNTTGTTYSPGTLAPNTTYYWQIFADNVNGSTGTAVWSFTTGATTMPAAPTLIGPGNGTTGVSTAPSPAWNAATGAVSYDVYFGTSSTPPLAMNTTGTIYTPGTLAPDTTYYWQVVAKNAYGSSASAVWSFTTAGTSSTAPVLIAPANGVTRVTTKPALNWDPVGGATSYEVYFGTSSVPPYVGTTASTSYSVGALSANTTYYWQISAGGSAASPVWSFTTGTGVATSGLYFVPVTPCRVADTRNAAGPFGGPTMTAATTRSFTIPQSACNIPATAAAYSLNVTVVPDGPLGYLTLWPTGQLEPVVSTLNSPGTVVANAAIVPAGTGGAVSVFVSNTTDVILDINGYFAPSSGATSYAFYSATPCRIVDTRGASGQFGGPAMQAGLSRDFPVPLSSCAVPATAAAYSLNVTVVPEGPLGYLTAWPTGEAQPNVSTLNSPLGQILANAAIVPAGTTNESVSVFVTNPTNVLLDINGYFAQPGSPNALTFYPVTPCRVADTRNADGLFGGPEMAGGTVRSFTIPASACNLPPTAAAYSLNVTVVPDGPLSYLTVWPEGLNQPLVSTLNSVDGSILANAAIVPAGSFGAIAVFVTDPTQVILDINGYFAP